MSGEQIRDIRVARLRRWAASIAVVLAVAACSPSAAGRDGAITSPPPGASTPPSAAASADSAVAAASSPSAEPSAAVVLPNAGVLPRSLTYGALNWTVTDAAITNQDPKTYQAGVAGRPATATSLIVDFAIRNDSPHIGFVTTTSRLVVELPDGSIIEGKDLERPSAAPQSTVESRYAFEVPAETAFDGLLLRFEDPGREHSLDLPLSGQAPDVETVTTTAIDKAIAIGIPGIEMEWTIDSTIAGRDWPLPIGFKGGTRVASARAEIGHRWVGIVARVSVDRCDCKGGVLDQTGSARLLVDGAPFTAAADESSKAIMQASTFSDVMLVFDIPAEATAATLQIGPLEEPEQQATIDLGLD
jgi:hypothetical protein